MTMLKSLTLCVLGLNAAGHASGADNVLTVGAHRLSLQAKVKCAQGARTARQLARYLKQYDPAGEPKEDIYDETPRSKEEIRLIRQGLVEHGLRYPNGEDSLITWMDVDGDGVCDFTASAGFGGMRAIDRMFLLRGLPNGQYRLADADFTYMEGRIVPVPYIPITVAGHKLPVLARRGTLLQWQPAKKRFATCPAVQPAALAALCPDAQRIYAWAARQLPHGNAIPYTTGD